MAALLLLCLPPYPAFAQNAPVGGGGSCTQSLEPDGTVGQQQAYDNGLYTCLSGGTWTPEALIVGSTLASGSAATCNSTNAGMLEYTGGTIEYCNGTSFTAFGSSNPGSGTIGGTSGVLVELTAGSAAAPSLTFYADTQTGIYQPSTSTMAITTTGTERAVFDGSGNFNLLGVGAAYEIDSDKLLYLPDSDTTSLAVGIGALAAQSAIYSENTAIGEAALNQTTVGPNSALGYYAGKYITTGYYNTAVGTNAMLGVSDSPLMGSSNTAVGDSALYSIQASGNSNTAIGQSALSGVTTGGYNTALGFSAGAVITTATYNVFIGYNAEASGVADTNEIVIGASARGNGSNTAVIGNSSTTSVAAGTASGVALTVGASGSSTTKINIGPTTGASAPSTVVTVIVATADATAQTANVSATTLVTPSANTYYRISCYVVLTTAATTSSTLPNCDVKYTDVDTNTAVTKNFAATGTLLGTTNTLGSSLQGSMMFEAKSGVAVQYDTGGTTAYASSGATAMQYAVHVKLEQMQ